MSPESVSLEQLLDLEQIEVWTYRGYSWHPESTRVLMQEGLIRGRAQR